MFGGALSGAGFGAAVPGAGAVPVGSAGPSPLAALVELEAGGESDGAGLTGVPETAPGGGSVTGTFGATGAAGDGTTGDGAAEPTGDGAAGATADGALGVCALAAPVPMVTDAATTATNPANRKNRVLSQAQVWRRRFTRRT